MNLEQLIYVRELVTTKSITIASEHLHITQSAISQSITSLEKEVGVMLFHRSRTGTIPTEEGKPILRKILEMLRKMDELQNEIESIHANYTGELKIASIPSLFMTYLPKSLARFKKSFPQIHVSVREGENQEVIDLVQKEEIDIGFIAMFYPYQDSLNDKTKFYPFPYQGSYKIIVSKDSELALLDQITIEEVQKQPFILYDREFNRRIIKSLEERIGRFNIIFETTNSEVIKRSVAEGLGVSLFTNLMLKNDPYIENSRIVALPIQSYLSFNIQYGVYYSKKSPHARLIQKFLDFIEVFDRRD